MISAESFWSRVDKKGVDDCWPWTKACFHFGHGAVTVDYGHGQDRAHRVAWIITNGPIPQGLCVLHCCDNPPCCNPSHLFLGTRSENTHDRDAKGRTAEGLKHGRYTKPQSNAVGTRNGRAKITSEQAIEIARARKAGATLSSIAARFGIGKSQVYRIANGQSWTERTAY